MGDECVQTQPIWVVEGATSVQKKNKNTNKRSSEVIGSLLSLGMSPEFRYRLRGTYKLSLKL